jgi:quinoprotein glucose dehydrogenase
MDPSAGEDAKPRYRWPWFVLGAFLLAVALAVLWMSFEVRRLRRQRDPFPYNPPARTNAAVSPDRLAGFRDVLAGGEAVAGRKVFFESPTANCGKCHKAGGPGGDSGPPLDGLAARQSREFILESILYPNAVINTNFQPVIVLLKDGTGTSGTLKQETATELLIVTPEDGPVTIRKNDIKERMKGASPMPEGIWQLLSRKDLADVVEFVAGLK